MMKQLYAAKGFMSGAKLLLGIAERLPAVDYAIEHRAGPSCEEAIAAAMEETKPDQDLRLAFDAMIDGVECNDVQTIRKLQKRGE